MWRAGWPVVMLLFFGLGCEWCPATKQLPIVAVVLFSRPQPFCCRGPASSVPIGCQFSLVAGPGHPFSLLPLLTSSRIRARLRTVAHNLQRRGTTSMTQWRQKFPRRPCRQRARTSSSTAGSGPARRGRESPHTPCVLQQRRPHQQERQRQRPPPCCHPWASARPRKRRATSAAG